MDPPILVFEWILIFAGHGGQEGTARQEDSGAVPQNGVCTIGTSLYLVYHRNLSSKIYQIRILQNRETLERTCYNLRDEVKELDSKVEHYVLVFQEALCWSLQCLQSSRSHVGGSNLDFCVEEKFQMTLNPWTGRSQLLPETFKFELRPVWWAAGTERHSPPPSPSWLERYWFFQLDLFCFQQ